MVDFQIKHLYKHLGFNLIGFPQIPKTSFPSLPEAAPLIYSTIIQQHQRVLLDTRGAMLCNLENQYTVPAIKHGRFPFLCQNTCLMRTETKMDDSILFPVKSSYTFW